MVPSVESRPVPVLARALAVATCLALAGCGGADPPDRDAVTAPGAGLVAREVVSGLDRPVGLAATPAEPGRLYVVEQAGTVRVVEGRRVRAEPFLDIRGLVRTSPKGAFASEQGLLSLAFAADYARSGRFFVFYTGRDGHDVVAAYRAEDGRALPASARVLLRIPKRSERHHGGQLHVGPSGRLAASVGDDERLTGHPQSLAAGDPYGRVLELEPSGAWRVLAYGLRNPWRFSFDRATGDLWIGDVGENAWEEVDRVRARGRPVNLGWPVYEGFHRFGEGDADGSGTLVWPVAEYSHEAGCSVTGGYLYRGRGAPSLRGRYVYGDYCTGVVWSVDPARPGDVREELRLPVTLSAFGEDAAGELYLVSRTGALFAIVK